MTQVLSSHVATTESTRCSDAVALDRASDSSGAYLAGDLTIADRMRLAERIAGRGDRCKPKYRRSVRFGSTLGYALRLSAVKRLRGMSLTGDLVRQLATELLPGIQDRHLEELAALLWRTAPRWWDELRALCGEMTYGATSEDYNAVYAEDGELRFHPELAEALAELHADHRRDAICRSLAQAANALLARLQVRPRPAQQRTPVCTWSGRPISCRPRPRRRRSTGEGSRSAASRGDPDGEPGEPELDSVFRAERRYAR
jgi:hypothetical protein